MTPQTPSPDERFRLVWFMFGLFFALAAAVGGCLLGHATGLGWAGSVMMGAGGFAGALTLAILIINFWHE